MSQQIAVRLPDPVLKEVDRLIEGGKFESRADLVRRAIDLLVRAEHRSEADQATVEGYTRIPETEEELSDAYRSAIESINEEPWEKWW